MNLTYTLKAGTIHLHRIKPKLIQQGDKVSSKNNFLQVWRAIVLSSDRGGDFVSITIQFPCEIDILSLTIFWVS